jgi:hypothetical protein
MGYRVRFTKAVCELNQMSRFARDLKRITISLLLLGWGAPSWAADTYNFNLSTDPIGWALGPNLRLDVRLCDHWTLGPALFYFNRPIYTVQTSEASLGGYVSYAFGEAMGESWFVDAAIFYGTVRAEATATNGQVSSVQLNNVTGRLLVGHQWYWGNFSLDIGIGEEVNSAGHSKILDGDGNLVNVVPIAPARGLVDTSLGLAF